MTYNNGDKYTGEWKNDKREGKGIMEYENGNIYDGEWKNDLKEGKGIMKYNNGDEYNGNWLNDLKEGKSPQILLRLVKKSTALATGTSLSTL